MRSANDQAVSALLEGDIACREPARGRRICSSALIVDAPMIDFTFLAPLHHATLPGRRV
jgi:hypothetical protein